MNLAPNRVNKFSFEDTKIKIPHMGWCELTPENNGGGIIEQDTKSRFYFVHSYFVEPANPQTIIGKTGYINNFTSAIAHNNVVAVQFHPEKSQQAGLKMLSNFLEWDGCWSN